MRKPTARLELAAALVAAYPEACFSRTPEMLIVDVIVAGALLDAVAQEGISAPARDDRLMGAHLSEPAVLLCAKLLATVVHAELDQLPTPNVSNRAHRSDGPRQPPCAGGRRLDE